MRPTKVGAVTSVFSNAGRLHHLHPKDTGLTFAVDLGNNKVENVELPIIPIFTLNSTSEGTETG